MRSATDLAVILLGYCCARAALSMADMAKTLAGMARVCAAWVKR